MDHFQGVIPDERWKNDMLQEQRKTNVLLEQIAQLLQREREGINTVTRTARGKRGNNETN